MCVEVVFDSNCLEGNTSFYRPFCWGLLLFWNVCRGGWGDFEQLQNACSVIVKGQSHVSFFFFIFGQLTSPCVVRCMLQQDPGSSFQRCDTTHTKTTQITPFWFSLSPKPKLHSSCCELLLWTTSMQLRAIHATNLISEHKLCSSTVLCSDSEL